MQALGMIETVGLLAGIVAADAMLKSAQVSFAVKQKTGGGLVTIIVSGDVAAAKAAVEAAETAIAPFHCLVSSHVIARPAEVLKPVVTAGAGSPEEKTAIGVAAQPPKPVKGPARPQDETARRWDRAYLESLKVVELRKLARKQKNAGMTGRRIRDGKKSELIEQLMKG